MIDDLFNLIIKKDSQIPEEFYESLHKLDFDYSEESIKVLKTDNLKMIKDIIYVLYSFYESNLNNILTKVNREDLLTLYNLSKDYKTDNFIAYYKKVIINRYML